MRAAAILLAYVASVFVAAAALAGPLALVLVAVGVEDLAFHKLTLRLLEVIALLGLIPLLASLGIHTRAHWGLAARPPVRGVLGGAAMGVAGLGLLALALLALGVRAPDPDFAGTASAWGRLALRAAAAGLATGIVEEILFRGGMHAALARLAGAAPAVAISALVYAAGHFIRPEARIAADEVGPLDGFPVLASAFAPFASSGFLDDYAAFVAIGVLLGLIRVHAGSIYPCIGVHAGSVLVIQVLRGVSDRAPQSSLGGLVGEFDGVVGLLGAAWFGVLAAAYWLLIMRRGPRAGAAGGAGRP